MWLRASTCVPVWVNIEIASPERETIRFCASPTPSGSSLSEPLGVADIHIANGGSPRSEEHTSELQSRQYLVCRLLLEKKHIMRSSRTIQSLSRFWRTAAPSSARFRLPLTTRLRIPIYAYFSPLCLRTTTCFQPPCSPI